MAGCGIIDALARAAKAGDKAAHGHLLKRTYGVVYQVIRRTGFYLPSGGDLDDLLQEGVRAVAEDFADWDESKPFGPWAATVAYREIVQTVRTANRVCRQGQNHALSLNAPVQYVGDGNSSRSDRIEMWRLPDESNTGRNPWDALTCDETERMLDAMAECLTPMEADVLRLFLAGKSYAEAARILNIGRKTLDNALQRARRKLAVQVSIMSRDPRFSEETRALMAWTVRKWLAKQRGLLTATARRTVEQELSMAAGD